ncbi:hypothetical protein JB92DRAFT_2707925, partial [Gautieria morchelliformis]
GLDPHQHTPIEILHMILLGIVQYFLRDAVGHMSDDQKHVVSYCLSSIDTAGLALRTSRMNVRMYVQHAGSLVGHDFCMVVQIALFTLYDILPPSAYAAWHALIGLVPLVWQPEIEDLTEYTVCALFFCEIPLHMTVSQTPKFHLLRHLPEHVHQFGPATLFATEGFESFNAVICSWSILFFFFSFQLLHSL